MVALFAGIISFSACSKDKGDGGDTEDGTVDAVIKKARELCECFKKASEAEGKVCVEVVSVMQDESLAFGVASRYVAAKSKAPALHGGKQELSF